MAEMKVRKLKTQYRADVRHKKISKVKTLLLQQKRVKITKSVIFTRHGSHDQNRYLNPRLSPLKKLKIVENQRFFGRICASKTCSFIFSLKIGCDQNRYLNRFWPFYIFGRSVVRFRSPIHRHVFRLLAVFSLPPVWEDPGTSQQCIFFDAEDHICRDDPSASRCVCTGDARDHPKESSFRKARSRKGNLIIIDIKIQDIITEDINYALES